MSVFGSKSTNVYSCAGFSDACITKPSTRSDDRRQKRQGTKSRAGRGSVPMGI